jgi:hypothetical protein
MKVLPSDGLVDSVPDGKSSSSFIIHHSSSWSAKPTLDLHVVAVILNR